MKDIKEIILKQRKFFNKNITKGMNFRRIQLKKLYKCIKKYENDIILALKKDLNKSAFESYETEIGLVYEEIKYAIKNMANWARTKKVRTSIMHFPSRGYIYNEPYGTVLIMSPWNYPFQLTIVPLIGSISAGNCNVVKPSEYSFYTAEVIEKILDEAFDDSYVTVVRGGRDANKNLLEEEFDYIFFTGSPSVGKTVMKAAAENLTPITLELGGKSPCIIDKSAKVNLSTKRIVWGKLLNAGQTCIAPDYLIVHKSLKNYVIENIKKYIEKFYGEEPEKNRDYPKIINRKHFERLVKLIKDENIVYGGGYNEDTLQIAPTIIDEPSFDSEVMREEIFGPILPIITFDDFSEVFEIIKKGQKPLALYLFSEDSENQKKIMKNISFGGGCINDTIIHIANSNLPFGGVGYSGMGHYHGKASFNTFSHEKSVVKKSNLIDIPLRYPPFKNNLKLLKKIMK